MTKQEWKSEYRQYRIEARHIAEEQFTRYPTAVVVNVPFYLPVSGNYNTHRNIASISVKR